MRITLDWPELAIAASVGMRRHIAALRQGLQDKHGMDPEEGWGNHVEGAAGEMAAAKAMDRYWNGSVDTFQNGGDVGRLQVRTRRKQSYELIVRPHDRDADVFVLVVGVAPVFDVRGWMMGRDAKQPEWLMDHGGRPPAYFVPSDALHPIGELREVETLKEALTIQAGLLHKAQDKLREAANG